MTFCLSLLAMGQGNGFNMERVTISDLLTATSGKAIGFETADGDFRNVEIDSRTIHADDIFWAVQGNTHDGHDFVADAILSGATAAVIETNKASHVLGPLVQVHDSLTALWDFSSWYRKRQDALVIGVTGSVGKTTAREMIHATLSAGFTGTRSPHNYNNHFGVPLSLLEIESAHEFAVLELAASRVGEIRELSAVAAPEIGVVTAVGEAHLDGFNTIDNVVLAKGELIESLPSTGFAVLAGDDPRVRKLAQRTSCRVLFVGETDANDLRADEVTVGRNRLSFRVDNRRYSVAANGRHHLTAALVSMAIAREIGMSDEAIAAGLQSFAGVAGRCRIAQPGQWTIIDDTYNANPSSMQAACQLLRDWRGGGKRLMVAADMLELGDRSDACHRKLGETAVAAGIDRLLVFGQNAEHVVHGALEAGMDAHCLAECEDFDALLVVLDCWLEPEDVVLVKGSRAMRMERVVEWLSAHNDKTYGGQMSRTPLRACA